MKFPRTLFAGFASWLAVETAGGAQSTAPVSATVDEAVMLSPFQVSTSKDQGYEASETLSGTRLSTPNKFVGAAITDVTPALMQDLALTNMQDLINFVPNSASYFGGGIGGDEVGAAEPLIVGPGVGFAEGVGDLDEAAFGGGHGVVYFFDTEVTEATQRAQRKSL
jgi:hypothetical protein